MSIWPKLSLYGTKVVAHVSVCRSYLFLSDFAKIEHGSLFQEIEQAPRVYDMYVQNLVLCLALVWFDCQKSMLQGYFPVIILKWSSICG